MKTKTQMIDEHLHAPFKVGEDVDVLEKNLTNWPSKPNRPIYAEIVSIDGEVCSLKIEGKIKENIPLNCLIKRTYNVGHDPFKKDNVRIQAVSFTLDSINSMYFDRDSRCEIEGVAVQEMNFNPFVYLKSGEKFYYQRDYVWSLEDKQKLIHSIYNGIDLGSILVRKRSYSEVEQMAKNGEKELAFADIVDGKQRLLTIWDFMNDKFADKDGVVFSEFSKRAKRNFTDHQLLKYAEMERVSDEQTLQQFYIRNITGVEMDVKHLNEVKKHI